MKRILGFVAMLLLAAPGFGLNQTELEAHMAVMISIVEEVILQGQPLTVFDGAYVLSPTILIEDKGYLFPNGNLSPVGVGELGVIVNQPFLRMKDTHAQLFALAHELGHAFSEKVLKDIGCGEAQGIATEVIADFGAVKILQSMGTPLDLIDTTVANWRKSMIFNVSKSGDHPPGADRYAFVHELIVLLKEEVSFASAAKQIIKEKTDAHCS